MKKNNCNMLILLLSYSCSLNFCNDQPNATEQSRAAKQFLVQLKEEINFDPNEFAYLVARRYYLIQRLAPVISILIKQTSSSDLPCTSYQALDIIHCPSSSQATRGEGYSLKPLFMVWDDFVNFKSIEDQVLIEDFTKEILLVSLSLSVRNLADFSTERNLLLNESVLNKNIHNSISKSDNLGTDLEAFISINDVATRFYVLSRISNHVEVLKKVPTSHISLKPNLNVLDALLAKVKTPAVATAIRNYKKDKSIQILLRLIKDFEQYKYIKFGTATRDFLAFMYIALSDVYNNCFAMQLSKKYSSSNLITFIANMDSVQLDEMLELVDIVAEELPAILEKYELTESELSWKQWFKKYWWTPPLILAKISFIIWGAHKLIASKSE